MSRKLADAPSQWVAYKTAIGQTAYVVRVASPGGAAEGGIWVCEDTARSQQPVDLAAFVRNLPDHPSDYHLNHLLWPAQGSDELGTED